jgi:hypothetical protein
VHAIVREGAAVDDVRHDSGHEPRKKILAREPCNRKDWGRSVSRKFACGEATDSRPEEIRVFFQKLLEVRFDDFPRDFHGPVSILKGFSEYHGPVSILTWSLCLCRETKSQFLEHVASSETKHAF